VFQIADGGGLCQTWRPRVEPLLDRRHLAGASLAAPCGSDLRALSGRASGQLVEIFETVFEPSLATQMFDPPYATPTGLEPTGIVAVTVFDTGSIFDTVFEP